MKYMTNLEYLRKIMKEKGYDYYIIPSSDSHQSEYVPDYYKGRQYVSGFTGSAGTLLVSLDEAFLWTDGRYFIQAESEIKPFGIKLMKMRTPGFPSIEEWINENIKSGEVLGFDGEVISKKEYEVYEYLAKKNNFNINMNKDLLCDIWSERPDLPKDNIFILDEKFAGKSAKQKIEEVRKIMKKNEAENYIISSLDDIAWLLNLRGNDILYNPVFLSYVLITQSGAKLCINRDKITNAVDKYLQSQGIIIEDYADIYEEVSKISNSVMIDSAKVNAKIYNFLKKDVKIIEKTNVTTSLKAVKNDIEIENIKKSHIRDGVAMVKFTKWLKENIGKIPMSEISISDKLEGLRSEGENFKGLSFNTIAGYKEHAAMMHYSADKKSDYKLSPEGMLLVDSGAQYLDGTTDITRTFILGEITEEEKRDFTLVLKGHIALASAIFLKGSTGESLDVLARKPLWDYGIDYKCGTGHGVGFYLNVHEGPHSIRPKGNYVELEPGMIVTNEPGVYKEGKFGIRTENIMLVEKAFEKEDMGEFLKFKTISYAPIDLDGIDAKLLSEDEKAWINNYHKEVYYKLNSYLNEDEKEFLKKATMEIK